MRPPCSLAPFSIALCLVTLLLAGCGNTERPTDRQIASDHCWSPQYAGGSAGGKIDLNPRGRWTRTSTSWVSESQYSYSVPYEIRAARFEVERLPAYPAAGPQPNAGTLVFPVRIHKVIERRYNAGNISVETLNSMIPPRSEEIYTAYYYNQRGVYYWKWTKNMPARGR